jgi:hypothetical protein
MDSLIKKELIEAYHSIIDTEGADNPAPSNLKLSLFPIPKENSFLNHQNNLNLIDKFV